MARQFQQKFNGRLRIEQTRSLCPLREEVLLAGDFQGSVQILPGDQHESQPLGEVVVDMSGSRQLSGEALEILRRECRHVGERERCERVFLDGRGTLSDDMRRMGIG